MRRVHCSVHGVYCTAPWVRYCMHVMHRVHWVVLWVHCKVYQHLPCPWGIHGGSMTSHRKPCCMQNLLWSRDSKAKLWEG